MNRVESNEGFNLWEYAWFAAVTALLLTAGALLGLIELVVRMFEKKRK